MKFNKILAIMLFAALLVALPAQTQTVTRGETTAEEDYLSNFEDIIIAELSASEEYDNKLLALQYIEDALAHEKLVKKYWLIEKEAVYCHYMEQNGSKVE